MKNIIASIRDAIDKKAYLPALALALTIPDVCGKVAYPDITGKGATGERYKKWFEEYVEKYYMRPPEPGEDYEYYFDADMCYALRNKVLHENRADIKFKGGEREKNIPHEYEFKLMVSGSNSFGSLVHKTGKKSTLEEVRVKIVIPTLCEHLCSGAEDFAQKSIESILERFDIEVVDTADWAKRHRADTEVDWDAIMQAVNDESDVVSPSKAGEDK